MVTLTLPPAAWEENVNVEFPTYVVISFHIRPKHIPKSYNSITYTSRLDYVYLLNDFVRAGRKEAETAGPTSKLSRARFSRLPHFLHRLLLFEGHLWIFYSASSSGLTSL